MAPKAAKRKLSRQSTDVCVKRALKDNFSSEEWTPDLVYSKQINGLTLVQFLTDQISKWRAGDEDVTRGSKLYATSG